MSKTITTLIAAREGFELHLCPDRSDCVWIIYKLTLTERQAPKRTWLLGWHHPEQRLARNRDNALLCEHYPAIHEWVLHQLRQLPAREQAADVHDDAVADASVAPARTSAANARADTLARADEKQDRSCEMQQDALHCEAEAQRERDARANWHRARYANYLAQFGAFGWRP
jgi:hypothetical protein